ncbi:DUF2303 family protein [Sphingomonas sp. C8-2]|nr:DUF2303 family protein [Sphingomonas sp. C8-2]
MDHDDQTLGSIVRETRDLVETYIKPEISYFSISDAGRSISLPIVKTGDNVEVLRPDQVEPWAVRPRFRHGTANLLSLDALIDHICRFKDEQSVIFADNNRSAPTITAVLDYHPAGGATDTAPRFGKHRSHYAFPLSEEWKAWKAMDGKTMPMAAFAEFLEERIVDVVGLIAGEDTVSEELQKYINSCGGTETIADPAKLMELSRGLQVYESAVVKQANRLSSGEGELTFEVNHTSQDGKPLKVPSLFLIAIPVFYADGYYRIAARLRYRKTGEGIVFWYDLWRTDHAIDHAFTMACQRVAAATELPLLLGRPE